MCQDPVEHAILRETFVLLGKGWLRIPHSEPITTNGNHPSQRFSLEYAEGDFPTHWRRGLAREIAGNQHDPEQVDTLFQEVGLFE